MRPPSFLSMRARALAAAAVLCASAAAGAQVPISGSLSDSTTGPLLSGVVYHTTSSIDVPAGQTLTAQPGAIVKFGSGHQFSISGTLDCQGTSGSPVIFTDVRDDTAGGDTNGDGNASAPAKGHWRALFFYGTSGASTLDHTEVRYAGSSGYGGIDFQQAAAITVTNSTVRDGSAAGIDVNGTMSLASVSGCTFKDNNGAAVANASLAVVPGFVNNTASGNGGNYIRVTGATVSSDLTIGPQNCMNGALVLATSGTVSAGAKLTLLPGVVWKFSASGVQLLVHGTLSTQGAYLTELRDDTIGGDTNGDGNASSPTKGFWRGIFFYSGSDASVLDQTEVRYGGSSGYGGIDLQQAVAITLSSSTVRDCSAAGIDMNGTLSLASVSGCTFKDNNGTAVANAPLAVVPGFVNNSATGNGGNYIRVTNATVSSDLTIGPQNCMNGALVLATSGDVLAGKTLTLQPGVVWKFSASGVQFLVHGTLSTQGAYFTELRDDTIGGDTNGDGNASSPAKGFWRGLFFYSGSDASVLDQTEVRYAGSSGFGGIDFQQAAAIAITSSTVRDCSAAGIDMNGTLSLASVSGCTFKDNNGTAVANAPLAVVPGFVNNSATGNGGNYIRVTNATVSSDLTIGPQNCMNGALVLATSGDVLANQTLTLLPGVVWKFSASGAQLLVHGTLLAQGTSTDPVYVTELRDDTIGGDTNGDLGASLPAKGFWRGFFFYAGSDASVLDHLDLRFAGSSGYGGIDIVQATAITVESSVIRDCAASGIQLNNQPAAMSVQGCTFKDNNGVAVDSARLPVVPGFVNNHATGNGGNYIRVTVPTVGSDVTIGPENCMEGALVLDTSITVNSGARLTLEPGVVFKFKASGAQVVADGAFEPFGGPGKPVVMTDLRDDTVGGDTNGDGAASAPAKGFWRGIFYQSTTDSARATWLLLRYAGSSGYAAITCSSALQSLDHVRAEHCAAAGFGLSAAASAPENLVAWDCNGWGIDLFAGGAFDLRHATSVANGAGGIRRAGTYAGTVIDSIAWGNPTNYSGFGVGQLAYSDGSAALAGANGNLNLDPLFVDAPNGDLHLQAGSPCIDSGDPLSGEDPDCTPSDMGAYPFDHGQAPFTYCTGKTNSAGCVPYVTYSGHASASSPAPFLVRALDLVNKKNGLFFYGLNGPLGAPFQGGFLCVKPPQQRLGVANSGGSASPSDCSGVLSVDFNALIQGGTNPMLVPGTMVNVQGWYRDPLGAFQTGLTDSVQFWICN